MLTFRDSTFCHNHVTHLRGIYQMSVLIITCCKISVWTFESGCQYCAGPKWKYALYLSKSMINGQWFSKYLCMQHAKGLLLRSILCFTYNLRRHLIDLWHLKSQKGKNFKILNYSKVCWNSFKTLGLIFNTLPQ